MTDQKLNKRPNWITHTSGKRTASRLLKVLDGHRLFDSQEPMRRKSAWEIHEAQERHLETG